MRMQRKEMDGYQLNAVWFEEVGTRMYLDSLSPSTSAMYNAKSRSPGPVNSIGAADSTMSCGKGDAAICTVPVNKCVLISSDGTHFPRCSDRWQCMGVGFDLVDPRITSRLPRERQERLIRPSS